MNLHVATLWDRLGSLFSRPVSRGAYLLPVERMDEGGRLASYSHYTSLYNGWIGRCRSPLTTEAQGRWLRFNLFRPIVLAAAEFTVGPDIGWDVAGDGPATQAAQNCWYRSGGDAGFIRAVRELLVKGEALAALWPGDDGPSIRFVRPDIVTPEFDPTDNDRLVSVVVDYTAGRHRVTETVTADSWEYTIQEADGRVVESGARPHPSPGHIPAQWLRNEASLGGEGVSELAPIEDLVIEYDHIMARLLRVADRYGKPTPVLKGVTKPASGGQSLGDLKTVVFLPSDGEASFLEWRGHPPSVLDHATRCFDDVLAISETPAIALGRVDNSFSGQSGVALRVLYSPLLRKASRKRKAWGVQLERLIALAIGAHETDVSILWRDAIGSDEAEEVAVAQAKLGLGVSRSQALTELGYSADQVSAFEVERTSEAEAAIERSARAFAAGSPLL